MNKTAILACAGLLMLGACSHKTTGDQTIQPSTAPGMVLGTPAAMLPKATLFKMSGNYADKVAVGYSNGQLTYYPAPTDISAASAPLEIGNGWWLNRQGLGQNAVFTNWTFAEYAALKKTPSVEEIISNIIPGSRVTEMMKLPIGMSEALADPSLCKKYIK